MIYSVSHTYNGKVSTQPGNTILWYTPSQGTCCGIENPVWYSRFTIEKLTYMCIKWNNVPIKISQAYPKICIEKNNSPSYKLHNSIQKIVPTISYIMSYMYINSNCHREWQNHYNIIDWGEVSNMCGARCLIGRGEASKGARCPRGRDVNWGEMSGSRFGPIPVFGNAIDYGPLRIRPTSIDSHSLYSRVSSDSRHISYFRSGRWCLVRVFLCCLKSSTMSKQELN